MGVDQVRVDFDSIHSARAGIKLTDHQKGFLETQKMIKFLKYKNI